MVKNDKKKTIMIHPYQNRYQQSGRRNIAVDFKQVMLVPQ